MITINHLIIFLICLSSSFAQFGPEYRFSYSTGKNGPAQMFRQEERDVSGRVTGKYGYVDPYGSLRVVQYESSPESGFIARGDIGTDQEAMKIARQMADNDLREKLPFLQHWNAVAERNTIAPSPWTNTADHLSRYKQNSKLLALNPPHNQDWSSGAAVSSFMQSIGYQPTYQSTPTLPTLPPLPEIPTSPEPKSSMRLTSGFNTNPFQDKTHTFVSLTQGGPTGYNYHYSY